MRLSLAEIREHIRLTPAQFIMFSFVGMSLIGGLVLMLPVSNIDGQWRGFVDSFFMSTSAVCVTGLVVADIGHDFTLFGQFVHLVLMQIGGLSYMTITTILLYMIGKRLSISGGKIFDLSNNSDKKINFTDFVFRIGFFTIVIEFFGFLALLFHSYAFPYQAGQPELGWFAALFHSVSAFCNAGMALYSDSLFQFRDEYWVQFVFSFLPILGGLGYTVLHEFAQWWNTPAHKPKPHFSFHARICFFFTLGLLISGVLIQLVLLYAQNLPALSDASFLDKLWISFFQTCAARSSGFATIDLPVMGDASLLLLIVWMVIGACPGGTGGGFKTTTLAVIFAIIYATLKNNKDVNLLNRKVTHYDQQRAITASTATIVGVAASVLLISAFEWGTGMRFIDQLFEVASAFTTVGLSTGITGDLSDPSLIVLCFCMIVGRPGPLLFLMAIIHESSKHGARYPEEGILIG